MQERMDGLALALMNNRFESVVRAMMNTLLRTARSAILNTARDFSCCILTADDEMLAMAESLPIHVMSGPDLMARYHEETHPTLRRGDAFLHNSPYHGNSHAPTGRARARRSTTRGPPLHRPRQGPPGRLRQLGADHLLAAATRCLRRGRAIFPCVKVQEDYQMRDDVLRMAGCGSACPSSGTATSWRCSGRPASVSARLLELLDEVGAETLDRYSSAWFDYSEQRMIAAIRAASAGHGRADTAPTTRCRGCRKASISSHRRASTPSEAMIEVDLRDNLDCQPCGLNLTEATARTAAMMGIFYRPRRGRAAERRQLPAAASAPSRELRRRHSPPPDELLRRDDRPVRVDGELRGQRDRRARRGLGLAEIGRAQPISMGVISGNDPARTAPPYVNQLVLAVTGGPARRQPTAG